MKRIAAALATSVVLLLGSAGAAHAGKDKPPMTGCGGGYIADALSTHLSYKPARWDVGADADEGTLGISAPRGWSFVRTPTGEGRFHDRTGNDLLSLRTVTEAGTPAAHLADQVRALAGTSGLVILGQHTKVVPNLDQTWSTLAYRYTSSMGEPREVKVRWIASGTDPAAERCWSSPSPADLWTGPGSTPCSASWRRRCCWPADQ